MDKKGYIIILVFCLLLLFGPDINAQCAMCKQAAETSLKSNPKSIARGLNSGILYLMAIPYVMLLFIFRKQLVQVFNGLKGRILKQKHN